MEINNNVENVIEQFKCERYCTKIINLGITNSTASQNYFNKNNKNNQLAGQKKTIK